MKSLRKYRLVYFEWEDASSPHNSWHTTDEFEQWIEKGSYRVKQVGFVYKETKKGIWIFGKYLEEDSLFDAQFGHLLHIPKTWIRKRIDLTKYIK